MKNWSRYALLCLGVLPLTACARCAPGKVAHGVSRLTIRNVGAVATLALRDTRCGFESEAVRQTPKVEGEVGTLGTVTYSVRRCRIEFSPDNPYVGQDCNGTQTVVRGAAVIDATQVITGIITGEPSNPVVPAGPDAASVELSAELTDFSAESTVSRNTLTIYSGSVEAVMRPRLAVDDDKGACSIPTKNVRFERVSYGQSRGHVATDTRSFDVTIDASDLYAVNGQYQDMENELWGEMTVWGEVEPIDGGEEGLDPDYDRDTFHASYACSEGIANPVNYACDGFLAPTLAQNAARLSVRVLGRIAYILERDSACGFSSPDVLGRVELAGEVGGLGTATLRAESCVIDLPQEVVVREDCVGTQTFARGRVVVSGTKTISGRLTGDLHTPAVPMSDAPAEIRIQVESFDDFRVTESGAGLLLRSGKMSGTLTPRTARDASLSGACAYVTSVSRISDIAYDVETDAQIFSEGTGSFDVRLSDTRMQAVSGTWGADSNLLDGYISVDGERFDLPTDPADDGLDPTYDQQRFDETWTCGTLQQPVSYECAFDAPLAQGASQLSILMAGTLAKLLDADERCGFSSPGADVSLQGETGRRGGVATFTVAQPCRLDFGERTEVARDCNGKATYASGAVELTGEKIVEGVLTGDPASPVVPTSHLPAELRISARMQNFGLWTDPETQRLVAKSGRLSGALVPRTGLDLATGACSMSTPVSQITDVTWEGADVTLEKDGKRFDLRLERSDLFAQNGRGEAHTNYLAGTIDMDGTRWDVPVDGNPILDPDYEQATFDASYACTERLQVVQDPSECDLYQALGESAARLLVLTAARVASEVNADDECGFEDFWVKTDPDRVEGEEGSQGLLEWNIADCDIGRSASASSQAVATDCHGRESFWQGSLRIDARRTVRGLRKDEYWIFDSVEPDDPTSVEIELAQVGLTNFHLWEDDPGVPSPLRGVRLDGGLLSGIVAPITGARADDPSVFDVTTPVAHMYNLSLSGAPMAILSGQKTFKVFVESSDIEAFNGSYRDLGMQNLVRGNIVIDGVSVDLDTALVSDYSQSEFDASYSCLPNLAWTITPM